MLDLGDYFDLTGECLRLGLGCFSVINGTRVKDRAMAERMIAEGPSEITVSLNSQDAEVHDRTRGVTGAFDMAVRALRLLVAAREASADRKPRVYAMAVVCEETYRELEAFL